MYVANCLGGNIARVPAEGGPGEVFATHDGFACPNGITFDGDSVLYVVNNLDTRVFRVGPTGGVDEIAHLPGSGHGHVVWAQGGLYITQLWNHEVVRLDVDGSVTSVAGDGRAGHTDGPSDVSRVRHPNGLAATRGGTLYFNTIRGPMMLGDRAELALRRIELPSPFRVLLAALDDDCEAIRHAIPRTRPGKKKRTASSARQAWPRT